MPTGTRSYSFKASGLQLSYELTERLHTGPSDSGIDHVFQRKGHAMAKNETKTEAPIELSTAKTLMQ